MSNPNSEHMSAAKRVLRYIRGTSSLGLRYEKGKRNFFVQGFSESDFAGDSNDRKSTIGQVFFIGNSAISWNTVKQNVVTLSSCEAEYIAASTATCQGMWIIQFIEELLSTKVSPFKLFVDNKSAIALSKNPSQHRRSKHIETKFHFIRDCVEKGYVKVEYVKTESQLADSFTKPLGRIKFDEFRENLGVATMNEARIKEEFVSGSSGRSS